MRLLFSSTSGEGHLNPMLPLAGALRALDHEVAFAVAEEYAGVLTSAGFEHLPVGIGLDELNARTMLPYEGQDALPLEMQMFTSRFALGDAPERLAALDPAVEQWSPDVVVSEPCDLAAPVAAGAAGLPLVLHSFGRPMPSLHYAAATSFVEVLWRGAELSPPPLCGVYGGTYLDICPPSLHSGDLPADLPTVRVRASAPAVERGPAPDWLRRLAERPLVYVTLGTIFNNVERFRPILAALAEVDCSVLLTVGRGNDPADLAPVPPNARVERYVPQHTLLPHVDVMVAHGGSGSMLAAFSYGIPQLMLPGGADQFRNAEACVEHGSARALAPADVTPERLRAHVLDLLTDPGPRRCAGELAEEIAAMPSPLEAAQQLLDLLVSSRNS